MCLVFIYIFVLDPIGLRFAFGKSFGSFLTKLSHMDPCLGICFISPTFVLHHCLYQTVVMERKTHEHGNPMANCAHCREVRVGNKFSIPVKLTKLREAKKQQTW